MSQTMPFSSDELVKKSNEFLGTLKTPECPGCARGVRMCYHTPCIGTVDDLERLIDAGYAKKLMLDYWCGIPEEHSSPDRENPFTSDVMYLVPAITGLEGKTAPFARHGKCTMLVDNQCSIHASGLKPIQGKLACCKVERLYKDDKGQDQDIDERMPILHTWNTQRGKDLIKRWREEINFEGELKEEQTGPETIFDLLDSLLGVLSSTEKMSNPNSTDGRPEYDPNEKLEREVQYYEKPY